MRKFVLIICVFPFLFSCLDYSYEIEQSKLDHIKGPTTKKEKEFIDSLKSMGFSNIQILVPIINRSPKYGGVYNLKLELKQEIDYSNLDSIKKIRDEIADYLYKEVISDSTLMSVFEITIDIKIAKEFQNKNDTPFLFKSYYKDSLAIKNNRRIGNVPN